MCSELRDRQTFATLMDDPARQRRYDVANASGRLMLTLIAPITATVLVLVIDPSRSLGVLVMAAWLFWFTSGPFWAWAAWCGVVSGSTLRVTSHGVVGRSGWPNRHWRSVDLDQLDRVSYRREIFSPGTDDLITVHDRAGGRMMVRFDPRDRDQYERLCRALLAGLDLSPRARATSVTRRRLSGDSTGLAEARDLLVTIVLRLVVPVVLAFVTAYGLGFSLDAGSPSSPGDDGTNVGPTG